MDYRNWAVYAVVFVLLVVIEGMVSGFRSGLGELIDTGLEKDIEDGRKHASGLLKLLDNKNRLNASCAFISISAGVLTGVIALGVCLRISEMYQETLSFQWWVKVLIIFAFIMLAAFVFCSFGIIVPERLAVHKPEKWAYRLYPLMSFLFMLLYPFVIISGLAASFAVRITGGDPTFDADAVTEEEIVSMVNEGQEQGLINSNEAEMINNIIEFSDKQAGDIMTHRVNVVAFDEDTTLKAAIEQMIEEGYSRIPIYKDRIDDVIGILHLKDAINYNRQEGAGEKNIGEIEGLLMPPVFIPETRNISDLLKSMQNKSIHQVVVVDEYGQMAGIITMEDIIEEIVGNIFDEYDDNEKLIEETQNGFIMGGMTPLEEMFEILDIEDELLDEIDYDTLNGLLISLLDRIPEEGEKPSVNYEGYCFEIRDIKNNMIDTVFVKKLDEGQ